MYARSISVCAGVLLLVSGVYYPITVLPTVLRVIGQASPLTYTLSGMRSAKTTDLGAWTAPLRSRTRAMSSGSETSAPARRIGRSTTHS